MSDAVPEIVNPVPGVIVLTEGTAPTVPPTVFSVTMIAELALTAASVTVTAPVPLQVNVPIVVV